MKNLSWCKATFVLIATSGCGAGSAPERATPPLRSELGSPSLSPEGSTSSTESMAPVAEKAPSPPPSASAPPAPPPPPSPCPDGMVKLDGGTIEVSALKRKTEVAPLCVDQKEVTAAAYEACVKAGGCVSTFTELCKAQSTYGSADKETLPMTCIDFSQADAYCKWAGKRLPTEAEWELAARGADLRKFAWGAEPPKDQACWSGGSSGVRKSACAVGSFPSGNTPTGLSDMTGNVFEWTGSPGDAKATTMIAKGGSWLDGTASQLAASRPGGFKPTYRCGFGGARCVTSPKP